jgi:hypothetical protein
MREIITSGIFADPASLCRKMRLLIPIPPGFKNR